MSAVDDVFLLLRRDGAVEQPRLRVMIGEGFGAQTNFGSLHRHRGGVKPRE